MPKVESTWEFTGPSMPVQGIAVGDSVADYIYRRALRPAQGRDRGDDRNDHHTSRRSHDANTHSGSSMAPPRRVVDSVHELALIELTILAARDCEFSMTG